MGRGYPNMGLPRALPASLSDKVNPDPPVFTVDPGDYFQAGAVGYGNGSASYAGIPDAVCWFKSPKRYNCIEIDINCKPSGAGYVVPDVVGLMLDESFVPRFADTVTTGGGAFLPTSQLNDQTQLKTFYWPFNSSGDASTFSSAYRFDFLYHPTKAVVATPMGTWENAANHPESKLVRLYGTKLFRYAYLAYWCNFAVIHTVPPSTVHPDFRFRCWYDPKLRNLIGVN